MAEFPNIYWSFMPSRPDGQYSDEQFWNHIKVRTPLGPPYKKTRFGGFLLSPSKSETQVIFQKSGDSALCNAVTKLRCQFVDYFA